MKRHECTDLLKKAIATEGTRDAVQENDSGKIEPDTSH